MLPDDTPLIGRQVPLDRLESAMAEAAAGSARRVSITGPAGIGKTRLLDEVVERARHRGWTVLHATGDLPDAVQPLGAVNRALGDAGAGGGNEPPRSVLGGNVAERRFRDETRLVTLMGERTHQAPVLLAIDDADLVDDSTRRVLDRLVRLLPDRPLLVLTTHTSEHGDEAAAPPARVELTPLDDGEVDALVQAVLGGPRSELPAPDRAAVADASGRPVLLAAVLADLRDRKRPDAAMAGFSDGRTRIRARIARLPEGAVDVLRTIAVVGRSADLEELLALRSDVDPLTTLRMVRSAADAGLVRLENDRVTIRNAMVAEELAGQIPTAVQRSMHRVMAAMLIERRASPARIAHHALQADGINARSAVSWLLDGAREVGSRAPTLAVELLEHAADIVEPDDPQRIDVLVEMVAALGWVGEFERCEQVADSVLAHPVDEPRRAIMRRALALCAFMQNRAVSAAEQCERSAAEAIDPRSRARALAEAALAHMAAADYVSSGARAREAIEAGNRIAEPISGCVGWSVLSRLRAFELELDDSLECSERAMAIAIDDPTGEAALYHPGFFRLLTLLDLDRLDDALAVLEHEWAIGDRAGLAWTRPLHHALAAAIHLFAGRLDEASGAASDGLLATEAVGSGLAAAWLDAVAALVALHRGDTSLARRHVDDGKRVLGSQLTLLGVDLLALAEARLVEREGDRRRACDIVFGALQLLDEIGMPLCARVLGMDAARLTRLTSRTDLAADIERIVARVADGTGLAVDLAHAELARAVIHDDAQLARSAVAIARELQRPLDRAAIAEGAAQVLWVTEHRDEAAALLDDALAVHVARGASADADRVRQHFADLGLRRPRRSRRQLDDLTSREAMIADLVATGRTNVEVAQHLGLSRRTVETHLTRIYAKLGLRSRTELAAARRSFPQLHDRAASG